MIKSLVSQENDKKEQKNKKIIIFLKMFFNQKASIMKKHLWEIFFIMKFLLQVALT